MKILVGSADSAASVSSDINVLSASRVRATRAEEHVPGPSSVVTLSEDAKVLSRFAEKGISMAMRPLNRGSTGSIEPNARSTYTDQALSKNDFQSLLEQFGATTDESSKLLAAVDLDRNGAVSKSEFLKLIAHSSQAASDASPVEPLLTMIDRSGDSNGSVELRELVRFTTAFADVQKSKTASF